MEDLVCFRPVFMRFRYASGVQARLDPSVITFAARRSRPAPAGDASPLGPFCALPSLGSRVLFQIEFQPAWRAPANPNFNYNRAKRKAVALCRGGGFRDWAGDFLRWLDFPAMPAARAAKGFLPHIRPSIFVRCFPAAMRSGLCVTFTRHESSTLEWSQGWEKCQLPD